MEPLRLMLIADASSARMRALCEVLHADDRVNLVHHGAQTLQAARLLPVPDLILLEVRAGGGSQQARADLSPRQREVLTLVAEGLTSAEIADYLAIAKGTVEAHREHIMRKLGLRNIAGLVKYGIRHGLLCP